MNKICYIFFLFALCISCARTDRYPSSIQNKHVVFDIDWTITSEVNPEVNGFRIIEVEGKKYFIHDGIEEFVEDLLQKEEMRISFFSGGSSSRNHSLLKQIKLHDGRSLEDIAYKILDFNDLTPIENSSVTDKFSLRYKKDLTKITKDLKNLVMIDDTNHFVLNREQENHVLFLGKTFQHFDTFSDTKLSSGAYVPHSRSEWNLARNKLLILKSAFNEAYRQTELSEISWADAVTIQKEKLSFSSNEWNYYSLKMYRNSLKSIENNNCLQLITSFSTIE